MSELIPFFCSEVIKKKLKDTDKGVIVFAILFMVGITITAWAYTIVFSQQAAAPNGRRWPVTTGMVLPMVNILDENGYYATLACTVTSFNNEAHTYNLSCGDAPTVIQVGQK